MYEKELLSKSFGKYSFIIFFILLISIPFLYRFIRVGKFCWFFIYYFNLVNDQKYIKAEI